MLLLLLVLELLVLELLVLMDDPVSVAAKGPAGDGAHERLLVAQTLDEIGHELIEVGREAVEAALGDRAQHQYARLLDLPRVVEERLLEYGQQDDEQLVAEHVREHVERRRRALAQVPLGNGLVVLVVVVVAAATAAATRLVVVVVVVIVFFVCLITITSAAAAFGLARLRDARGLVEARPDVLLLVGYVLIVVDVALEQYDVELRVLHAAHQDGYERVDVRLEHLVAYGLVGEHEPELARLERHRLILVLRAQQHVHDDGVHVRHELVELHVEQHHNRFAHVLAHVQVGVVGEHEQVLEERVHVVVHESAALERYELIDAGDGVRAYLGVRVAKVLDELGYEVADGLALLELLVRVLAYLLQGAERALAARVRLGLQVRAQRGQQLGPRAQTAPAHDGRDEYADGGAYELTRVADAAQALALDELLAPVGKLVEERLGVVLEYEAAE